MSNGTKELESGWAVVRGGDEFYVEHVKLEDPLEHPEGDAQRVQTWDFTNRWGALKPCGACRTYLGFHQSIIPTTVI